MPKETKEGGGVKGNGEAAGGSLVFRLVRLTQTLSSPSLYNYYDNYDR